MRRRRDRILSQIIRGKIKEFVEIPREMSRNEPRTELKF